MYIFVSGFDNTLIFWHKNFPNREPQVEKEFQQHQAWKAKTKLTATPPF